MLVLNKDGWRVEGKKRQSKSLMAVTLGSKKHIGKETPEEKLVYIKV
jgi:hypothetical protein